MFKTQETGIEGILAPNSKVETLAEKMFFCEGPVWDSKYNRLIFSDTGGNEHRYWSESEGLKSLRKPSFQPNGNVFDLQGRLITCEHESRAIAMTDTDGNRSVLVEGFQGRRFNSPNDLEVRADGTIWFTDPDYGLGDRQREIEKNLVYRFDPKTEAIDCVADDFEMPNGIAFSPDETKIYIGNSAEGDRKIRVFDIDSDGNLTGGKLLCRIDNEEWGADGVDVDANGNIYAGCGDGVHIFSPEGELLGKIFMSGIITNMAFGESDGKTLYMTSHTALYRVPLLVKGAAVR